MKQKVVIPLEEELLRCTKHRATVEGRRLSELIEDALKKYLTAGPHHSDEAVVVSANEFRKLSRPRGNLVEFFRKSPLVGVNLDLARSTDTYHHRKRP